MIKNYLKITVRNLLKHKGYSFINITGLAVGIACCLLIFIYVKTELTYDTFQSKKDRIFRVTSTIDFAGQVAVLGATGYPEAQAYLDEVPEIEAIVRVNNESAVVKKGDEYIQQNRLLYADPAIFSTFDFVVKEGALEGALGELNNLVLTERMAIKYFGTTDVIGESLQMNVDSEMETFYVTAVIGNHPSNSSFNFEMVMSWDKHLSQLSEYRKTSWSNISLNSFVLLREGAEQTLVEEKIKDVRLGRNPGEDGEFARGILNLLQPLTDIHLNTEISGGDALGDSGDPTYSYILSGIALVILILACINFSNLSVARSLPRASEIGVRKVLGALPKQLAFQFLSEALLMCMIAFVFGLILAELSLPVFGALTERTFHESIVQDTLLMSLCFGLVLLTALLSGFYPAFVISRFKVVNSLKGKVKLKGNSFVSKTLVVIQFAMAAILVVGTITMNKQIDYMVNKDVGYDDENLLSINAYGAETPNLHDLIIAELSKNPNIEAVAAGDAYDSFGRQDWGDDPFAAAYSEIDDKYMDVLGIELLEGRRLKKGRDIYITAAGDTVNNMLVNEAYVKRVGKDNILNKINGSDRVVGIIKDFHFETIKGEIRPMTIYSHGTSRTRTLSRIFVKYKPEYLPQVKSVVSDAWTKFEPFRPFDASFVAEANDARYQDDMRWKRIVTYATFLAIIISILGLFGLAHLATQQRTKEIGIRKVLGASLAQIIVLLNSSFAKLVLISIVLATPIAYYFIDQWLQNFAYPVNITALLFLVPGLITFSIAFITVSLQSIRSATANPIESLRYE